MKRNLYIIIIMIVAIAILLISCSNTKSNTDNSQDIENFEPSETNINIPVDIPKEDKDEPYTGTIIEDKKETIAEDNDDTNIYLTIDNLNYLDTELEEFKILNIEEIVDDKFYGEPQIVDGNVIFSERYWSDNEAILNYYIYSSPDDKVYKLSNQDYGHFFVYISDELAISIKFVETENNSTINHEVYVFNWDYKNNKVTKEIYSLDSYLDNIYSDFFESIYFEGDIFIAISSRTDKIIRINTDLQTFKIYDIEPIDFVMNSDTLVEYNNKLYVISDRDNINIFDKEKDEFIKLDPSSTYVTEDCMYYVKNRNEFEAYNGEYSAEFTLPYIEEDYSIHGEGLYSVKDAYKNNYVIGKETLVNGPGNLYVSSNSEIINLPIVKEDWLDAVFIDENKIIYTDEDSIHIYDINTNEKSLILESYGWISKLYETNENIYFFLYDNSILKYKK